MSECVRKRDAMVAMEEKEVVETVAKTVALEEETVMMKVVVTKAVVPVEEMVELPEVGGVWVEWVEEKAGE